MHGFPQEGETGKQVNWVNWVNWGWRNGGIGA